MEDEKGGYFDSYESSLSRLSELKEVECQKLVEEWSETKEFSPTRACPCCGKMLPVNKYSVFRTIISKIGEINYRRHYYYCSCCKLGFFPRDEELRLNQEGMTDDVVALALDFVINDPFEISAQRFELHHKIELSATKMQHLFKRQTAQLDAGEKPHPVVELPVISEKKHLPIIIENDGSMIRRTDGWHEVKLMRIGVLGETNAVYFAETLDKDRFEDWLREAIGFSKLYNREIIWLGDGAPYNWNIARRLCSHAHCLVDFYHVAEKISDVAAALFQMDDYCAQIFVDCARRMLLHSQTKTLINQLKECMLMLPGIRGDKARREELRKLIKYLDNNIDRLDYKQFLTNGWPIGSGAIESAHKWVLQRRMKQAGMKWSPQIAQQMAVTRALYASVGPKDFYRYLKKAQKMAA
jgi:hypothetical protein